MLRKRRAPRVALTDGLIVGGLAIILGLGVYLVFGRSHSAPTSHHPSRPSAAITTPAPTSSPPAVNQPSPQSHTIAGGLREIQGIHYGAGPLQVMDAFLPAQTTHPTPAVIFVHGGGFTTGDKSSLFPEAKGVASVGWAGITMNYRLTGYPDQSDDVIAAATWVHNHASELNVDPNQLGLLGTSAGGTLVAQAATVTNQQNTDLGIKAVVSWSGPMNLSLFDQTATQGAFRALNFYVGCAISACSGRWATASPYTHISHGDPPMYLFNSTCEGIPYNQATSMVRRLQSDGDTAQLYTIPGKLHALQYASQAYSPSVEWLTRFLGPIHGTIPAVPDNTGGFPGNPSGC